MGKKMIVLLLCIGFLPCILPGVRSPVPPFAPAPGALAVALEAPEDVSSNAAPALPRFKHLAYALGYPDRTFRPESPLSREEAAALFYRLIPGSAQELYPQKQLPPFPDVAPDRWSWEAIQFLQEAGIVTGYESGLFCPESPITRGEFASIAARFCRIVSVEDTLFQDTRGHWAAAYIDAACIAGWIAPFSDNTFRPELPVLRCEAVSDINRALDRQAGASGLSHDAPGWADVGKDAWYYADILEAACSHIYERPDPLGPERWIRVF